MYLILQNTFLMNAYKKIFKWTLFTLMMYACKEAPKENSPVTTAADTARATPVFELTQMTASFKNLVKTDTAIMRGVSWQSVLKNVTAIEDPKTLVEAEEDYYDYLITLDNKEQADVIYYFNTASQIEKIELNLYPANEISRAKFYDEFTSLFNAKYGLPTSEIAEVKIWKHPDTNTYIEMRMLGNSKIHDLQIDIKKMSVSENF